MGSLNGDVMVMRNGRSTSQVSVYNYPEHLNPFYEDDQHKRLRFWKISKKDNEGRRNSFSIGNLKDMWAFKTFRMKKKSSTLGINKTSESPPLLRRDYALDNGWNTFDHRLRASNTSSINGDSFQRNATYRSSLQTLPTNNDRIGLNRNDGYRSTIQVPRSNPRYQVQQKPQQTLGVSQNRRYVYGGSITPQPLRNSRPNIGRGPYEYDSDNAMIRGSSQSSMISTNPFESDDDENEGVKTRMRNTINGSTTTLISQTPRKKRRAPAPPTPIHGRSIGVPPPTIRIESSQDNTHDDLHIKEDMDIANLTAEIESFVKTKSNDDVEETLKEEAETTTATTAANTEYLKTAKVKEETDIKEITPIPNITPTTITATENITIVPTETTNMKEKKSDHITNETVIATTTNASKADVIKSVEEAVNLSQVSNENDESKEIKTNGAIPKKPTNNSVDGSSVEHLQQHSIPTVAELHIKETYAKDLPQKPVPLKRHTKPETEIGHVECIHVHVESPKATPRKDHPDVLSSFKTTETVKPTESITTKTPFVLTSPPAQKRKQQQTDNVEPIRKETVRIVGTTSTKKTTNELNIKEERLSPKPEISVKPTLSPKPVTKQTNGKIHNFADIHKPMRRNNQNGHVRITSRDGSISPPFVPQHETKNEIENINKPDQYITSRDGSISPPFVHQHETKNEIENINNPDQYQTNDTNEEKLELVKETHSELENNLIIVESNNPNQSNGNVQAVDDTNINEVNNSSSHSTVVNCKDMQKIDEEFDFLYRPKPASHMEWMRSTLAPLETNIPPEKRKSVKDIIESINRSQRLLHAAANKDFPAFQNQNLTAAAHHSSTINNNNNLNENLKILNEKQKEFERLVEKMEPSSNLGGTDSSPSPSLSNDNNDNEIFQKCKVNKEVYDYRETSPITSNLDWNPVPKPKRTKPAHE